MVAAQTRKRKRTCSAKNARKRDTNGKPQDAVAVPMPAQVTNQSASEAEAAEAARMERRAAVWRAFDRLRKKADKGDRKARLALVRFCNANPYLWEVLGDTAKLAETSIIDTVAKGEWLTGRAIAVQADQLRKQLSRPGQSALEDLAVRRFVACWVQVNFVDSLCGRADSTVERGKFWLARQSQAARLYAQAEKSLLLIRSLTPTSVPTRDTAQGSPELSEPSDEKEQNRPVTTDVVSRINRITGLNGNRVAGVLVTIGSIAEG
jgi:hypothetical protein